MLSKHPFSRERIDNFVVNMWIRSIIVFFAAMAIVIFPVMILRNAPEARIAEGVSGYLTLVGMSDDTAAESIFRLRGEWEFYPNQLYSFEDFTNGRTIGPRMVSFPHFWADEDEGVIGDTGYATYRMRVRVPSSFDGIGIYSRFQYSAYEIFLNEIQICGAGVISEDFSEHRPVYLPTNGYTSTSIGSGGRTFSVIIHVQDEVSDSGGLSNDIFFGSALSVKDLRTLLVLINGFVSGGLLLLFFCLLLIYLNGRERKEYLDYTIVSLVALFTSLTSGGESLMHSIGINSVLLVRLEYCAFITGAFFANYNALKTFIKSKLAFRLIHMYIFAATTFIMMTPLAVSSMVRTPIITLSTMFYIWPLLNNFRNIIKKRDLSTVISLISYIVICSGIAFYLFGGMPWDSVDLFSIAIMLHCLLQMVIFLQRYRKTEQTLKEMTETLEERIAERTVELTLMKEKAEAATIAKSNFLATMSHEIRTPMNAIMGISDLMRTDNLDKVQLNYLLDIKKSSRALLEIINDILDFSKIEAGKLEVIPVHFNLLATYDNICSLCLFSAEAKGLEFRCSFASDVPQYIFGDEIRYRQVILNVINNAIKYTRRGFVDFKVESLLQQGQRFLVFSVQDTGVGIKKEDFPRLFGAFEQLDSASNRKIVGTGLGLSITKLLVTLMNGDIQFESEYGVGSIFRIYLPLIEGDRSQVNVQEDYVPVIVKDARVLVVDDNRINLTVAMGFLAIHDIQAETALSAREAIAKIRDNNYDMVFMDHMMPEMDGVEATRIIRTMDDGRFRELPIVALTANAVTGVRNIFEEAGMNDFLSKPIDAAHLNMLLSRWLPQEKIVGRAADETESEIRENDDTDVLSALYSIEELDVAVGIAHVANSRTVYLSVLQQFCREFERYVFDILIALNSEDWVNYRIKVHAMKGVFANIGAAELSKWAYRLEVASQNEEYDLCLGETEGFCESMRVFYDKLKATKLLQEKNTVIEKTPIDPPQLIQKLEELRQACMFGDSDTAEEIGHHLNSRSFTDEVDAEIGEIENLISTYDFEIVIAKIDSILQRIGLEGGVKSGPKV